VGAAGKVDAVTVRLIRVERGGLVTAGQVVMALEPAA
jgi:hypothetical protein